MIRWKPFGPYVTALLAIAGSLYYNHMNNVALHDARVIAVEATNSMNQALTLAADQTLAAIRANERADSIAHARRLQAPAVAKIVAAAPDTCKPVIAALQGQLAQAQQEAQDRQVAYEAQKRATAALQPAGEHLADATHALVRASGPSFFSHITPRFGVGVAAGISAVDRKPDLVIGVTMSWGH